MDKKSAIVTGVFFSMLVLTGFVSFLATRGSQAEEEKLPVQKNFLTTSDPKSPFSLDVKDVAELQSLTAAQKSDVKSLTIRRVVSLMFFVKSQRFLLDNFFLSLTSAYRRDYFCLKSITVQSE